MPIPLCSNNLLDHAPEINLDSKSENNFDLKMAMILDITLIKISTAFTVFVSLSPQHSILVRI